MVSTAMHSKNNYMVQNSFKASLDPKRVPHHVAIIMDGNRRWAKNNGYLSIFGHQKGADVLQEIVEFASGIGVKILTVYSFSTENWKRSKEEIDSLFSLFSSVLHRQSPRMVEQGVRLQTIGDLTRLPMHLQETLAEVKIKTNSCSNIELVLALNYGSRDEIRRAVTNLCQQCVEGKLSAEGISEKTISSYLDTALWPDPDLLIRTSGEVRLSNFLLWQLSYSEIYITDTLWPDFSTSNFLDAIKNYQKRERRLGSR